MDFTLAFVKQFLFELGHATPVLLFLLLLIALVGLWIGRLEGWSRGEALYHAFINATTVGYGDLRPTRPLARGLAVLNAFIGLVLAGVVVALAVYAFQHAFESAVGAG